MHLGIITLLTTKTIVENTVPEVDTIIIFVQIFATLVKFSYTHMIREVFITECTLAYLRYFHDWYMLMMVFGSIHGIDD